MGSTQITNIIYYHIHTLSETALESARDMAQVPHPSSSSGLPSDRLNTPVVYI